MFPWKGFFCRCYGTYHFRVFGVVGLFCFFFVLSTDFLMFPTDLFHVLQCLRCHACVLIVCGLNFIHFFLCQVYFWSVFWLFSLLYSCQCNTMAFVQTCSVLELVPGKPSHLSKNQKRTWRPMLVAAFSAINK